MCDSRVATVVHAGVGPGQAGWCCRQRSVWQQGLLLLTTTVGRAVAETRACTAACLQQFVQPVVSGTVKCETFTVVLVLRRAICVFGDENMHV